MRESPLLPASRDSEAVSTLGYAAKWDLQRPKAAWEAPQLKGDDSFLKIFYFSGAQIKGIFTFICTKFVCPQ